MRCFHLDHPLLGYIATREVCSSMWSHISPHPKPTCPWMTNPFLDEAVGVLCFLTFRSVTLKQKFTVPKGISCSRACFLLIQAWYAASPPFSSHPGPCICDKKWLHKMNRISPRKTHYASVQWNTIQKD